MSRAYVPSAREPIVYVPAGRRFGEGRATAPCRELARSTIALATIIVRAAAVATTALAATIGGAAPSSKGRNAR